jgi:hypothetical protein
MKKKPKKLKTIDSSLRSNREKLRRTINALRIIKHENWQKLKKNRVNVFAEQILEMLGENFI